MCLSKIKQTPTTSPKSPLSPSNQIFADKKPMHPSYIPAKMLGSAVHYPVRNCQYRCGMFLTGKRAAELRVLAGKCSKWI